MPKFKTLPKYTLLFCLAIITVVVSCKSNKKLIKNDSIEVLSIDSLLLKIQKPIEYDWYEAKAKIKIESPAISEKGKLSLRMRKDSAILCAVKRLSIEGGRSLITHDSIFYINRIDHTYQIAPIDTIKSIYGVVAKYSYIESLFAGIDPYHSQPIIETIEEKDDYIVKVMINDILHINRYDRLSGLLKEVKFEDRFQINGIYNYSDYRYVNDTLLLPYFRELNVSLSPQDSIRLTLEFSKIELNKPGKIKFTIPQNYERLH